MKSNLSLPFIFLFLFLIGNVTAVLISDQGTTVKNSTGSLLSSGNLSIEIYDNTTGGTILFNQTYTDTIINGSWNLMINAPLEFGQNYWKEYKINGEDVDFDGNERLQFQSPLGMINNVSHINFSLITNYTNFTAVYGYALNASLWTLNYTNFTTLYGNQLGNASNMTTIYGYALNDSLWTLNYSNFTVVYGYALNASSSGISWATAINGTLLNYSDSRNSTLAIHTWMGNWSGYNASWSNITNVSLTSWANALNGTLALNSSLADYVKTVNWNATNTSYFSNISNFGVNLTNAQFCVYNSTLDKLNCSYTVSGTDTFAANYTNFTTLYGNQLGNASNFTTIYGNQLGNASNMTTIYGYAINDSLWTLNYSNFSTLYANQLGNASSSGISWATAYNGTLAKTDAANSFGAFNQSFNTSNIYLWALLNRTGIGTISPQNMLNVVGDANITTLLTFGNIPTSSINNTHLAQNAVSSPKITNAAVINTKIDVGAVNTSHLWAGHYNINITTGYFNVSNSTGVDLFVINASDGFVGVGTLTPQNPFNVIGVGNFTGDIFSRERNLSIGYDYAINSTDTFTANYTNFTTLYGNQLGNASNMTTIYGYALNDSLWTLNYTDYLAIRGYAINDSLWTLNYSTYLTKPTWAQVTNGTNVALVTAANSFGAFNQSFNTSNIYLWALLNRTGIQTTSPQNTLNVVGDINATTTVWSYGLNLTNAYQYATNGSLWTSNYSDYVAIRGYALNDSLWTLNYSNFSTLYGNQLGNASNMTTIYVNAAGNYTSGPWQANASNFTAVYGHAIGWANNASNFTTLYSDQLGNASNFTTLYANQYNNASNMTTIYGYALNDSLWTLNYSTYLTKPTYAQVTNGTDVALVSAANTFGNFNQTFNGTTLFLWALTGRIGVNTTVPISTFDINSSFENGSLKVSNLTALHFFVNGSTGRVGIGTNASQNTLNVVGDTNSTGTVYSFGLNLTSGYGYALNSSLWTLNYTDYLAIRGYALNDSLWTLNYSNFTTLYGNQLGNASNMTTLYVNQYNNASNMTTIYGYAINDSLWTLNYSTYLTKPTYAQVTNGTDVALVTAANSFGAFNQSFNTSNIYLWALLNRTGIGTISPQNMLNVVGDTNSTGTVYAQNKNLSVGYDYALNNTFTQNASAGNQYITNGTGGAYIYHNGTGWVIKG